MPVRIKERIPYDGKVSLTELNVEVEVVSMSAESEWYYVEGWLNLSQMQSGDVIEITEYVTIETEGIYYKASYSDQQEQPILHFPTKKLKGSYKLTLKQTAGTLRKFPFQFIKMVTEVV